MSFDEISNEDKILARAGYYKVHKKYLDNKKFSKLDSSEIKHYIEVRQKALKVQNRWTTFWVILGALVLIPILTIAILNYHPSETVAPLETSEAPVPVQSSDTYESSSETLPEEDNEEPDCNPNYSGCVENSSYDLDCPDIGEEVEVLGNDEYGLDRDGDGYGCESY